MKYVHKAIVHICIAWESLITGKDWGSVNPEERVSGCTEEGSVTFRCLVTSPGRLGIR